MPTPDRLTAANYTQALQQQGYQISSTGGGFTAWYKAMPAGHHVMLTNANDGHLFDSDTAGAVVCCYDEDHREIGGAWEGPLSEAHSALRAKTTEALDSGLKTFNAEEVIEQSLSIAVRHMQDSLGVKTGDTAGVFFSGVNDQTIRDIFRQYIKLEISLMNDHKEEGSEPTNLSERPKG